jgi:hypothetical protein
VTRTETGSVGLMFVALSPGRTLTCACGRGGALRPDGSVGPPEHAVSKIAKPSNINTRRMVPHRICPIAPPDRVSLLPVRSVTIQGGGEELSVAPDTPR